MCEKLGQGGAGGVYRVYHPRSARMLALKQLIGNPSWSKPQRLEMLARLEQEMKLLMELRHANIIRYLDHGVDSCGDPYFVTEYRAAGNLLSLSAQFRRHVPVRLAVDLILRVLDAVKYLHGQNSLHRDIKPDNVLLRESAGPDAPGGYVPCVVDLGVARKFGGLRFTRPNETMGSTAFMAAEQAIGQADVTADVYSTGATLYYLLCGQVPIACASTALPEKKLEIAAFGERTPILTHLPTLAPALATVIDRACCRSASERFPTAAAFQAALRASLP
jgi:serine/threonine-protein kinase